MTGSAALPLDQILQQGIERHRAGRLPDAELAYREVLRFDPGHPDANHNLGVLLTQLMQPASGLAHLKIALEARSNEGQYWLSYIEALLQSGQANSARQVLEQGRQLGLSGDSVDELASRVERSIQEMDSLASLFCAGSYAGAATLARRMTENHPANGFGWKVLGTVAHRMGRAADALLPMQRATELSPLDSEARFNLAAILQDLGRLDEAAANYRQAIAIKPDSVAAHFNLGIVLKELGKLREAAASYRRALEIEPDFAEAHCNLGIVLQDLGDADEAAESLRRAIAINPDYAQAHNNLGNALRKLGRHDAAAASYRQALAIDPDFAEANCNLGIVLQDLGADGAAEHLRRALQIRPDFVQAHYHLGNALRHAGALDAAAACCRRALEIEPGCADAHFILGNVLKQAGELDAAMTSYRRALEIKPDHAAAHNNLGNSLRELGSFDRAVSSYTEAVRHDPGCADAHSNLGIALRELGLIDEAKASFGRALELQSDCLQYAIGAHLALPVIARDADSLSAWRERFEAGIEALADAPCSMEDPGRNVNLSTFYLAYHNCDDREAMQALSRLLRSKLPALTCESEHLANWNPPLGKSRRIRLGILSEYLVGHTIGKLYRGLIEHLDRRRFEVTVMHTHHSRHDEFRAQIDAAADHVVVLPAGLENAQRAVMAEQLDALFYPDIGMTPSTYFLAHARLAPVQAVGWGHPDTTGIDCIDYFVSSESIEPANADQHYTERLIRLNRIPCCYSAATPPGGIPERKTLGLPETGTLYGCPQSLFKFHPDFDRVLAEIAEGDPSGRIVLIEGTQPTWAEQLMARWAKTAPVLLQRALFLPRIPMEQFMALLSHMDLLLDPIHFGSGNTLYEAMVYGTPVVTWPGQFMRGRIVAGAYRQMGVADAPVAKRLEDYAPLALALGRDRNRRQNLRQALLAAANRELFSDMQAIREFEAFLESAVAAAKHGHKLPAGWKPDLQTLQEKST